MSANSIKTGCTFVTSIDNSLSLAKNRAYILLLLLAAAVTAFPSGAQPRSEALYDLNQGSTFEQGCFPPCVCPEMIEAPVQGTFLLTSTGYRGSFYTYDVTEVNWTVKLKDRTIFITGSGTYKIGGEFALLQELSLDLQMGEGGTVQHFDSGLVPFSAPPSLPFPDFKVTISTNGQFCFDTVFKVSTSPERRGR